MKIYIKAFAVVSVLIQISSAWSGEKNIDCENAMTQMDMNICAAKDADSAEKKLQETFDKLLKKSDVEDAKILSDAKRSWEEFRKIQCQYNTLSYEGGSIQPMLISYCYSELSQDYLKILESHLNCEEGDFSCHQ